MALFYSGSIPVRPLTSLHNIIDATDIRSFFDDLADRYTEQHGSPNTLLHQRLGILDLYAQFSSSDTVLDVGCGRGTHLQALADRIGQGIGVDLSPRMIASARRNTSHPDLTFRVDNAERLTTIPTDTVDKVICVGTLEHVLRPARALQQVARVLVPGGRFVALTLNGAYWWYRLADRFRIPTRHLTSDHRLGPDQAARLLRKSGLQPELDFWRFIPSGDLPRSLSLLCRALDAAGQWVAPTWLRGGLRLCGRSV